MGFEFSWDFENRVKTISDGEYYVYNSQGQRIKKVDVNGKVTYYFFPEYEEEYHGGSQNNAVKYYFVNQQRVAENSTVH